MGKLERRFPLYSKLLGLYPAPYRDEYRQQMLQTLDDMLRAAPDGKSKTALWLRVIRDYSHSLFAQYVLTLGETMTQENGNSSATRVAGIGALLLIPFWLALVANSFDQLVLHRTLYNSWLWHAPVLAIWVLWLPAAALLLMAAAVAYVVWHRLTANKSSVFAAFFDLKRTWPLFAVGIVSLGILAMVFGHDSAHCFMGNPIEKAQHLSQTLQCARQGAADYPFQHPTEFVRRALGFGQ